MLLLVNWQVLKGFLENFSACRWAIWTGAMRRHSYVWHWVHGESTWMLHHVPGYQSISLVAIDQNQIPALRILNPEWSPAVRETRDLSYFISCAVMYTTLTRIKRLVKMKMRCCKGTGKTLACIMRIITLKIFWRSCRGPLALAFCHVCIIQYIVSI